VRLPKLAESTSGRAPLTNALHLESVRDSLRTVDPESGAGREVMATLGRLGPAQIIYVACDPVALSRDIAFAREDVCRPDSASICSSHASCGNRRDVGEELKRARIGAPKTTLAKVTM